MSAIQIFTLGELRIVVDGIDIAKKFKQSPKKLLLLEYLIVNRAKPATVSSLVDVLWNGKDDFTLENTLKTLISRLRKDLSELGLPNAIVTRRGAYMWNPDLECDIDMAKMDDICKEIDKVSELNNDSKQLFEDIIYMYNDDLLVDSSINTWIAPKSYYYHNLYLRTVYRYITLLNEQKKYSEVIRICKTALEVDTFDSVLNIELMSALLKMGKSKNALLQYQNITELHYAHLGVPPSQEILDFYRELVVNEQKAEANIEEIYNDLKTDDVDKGGFVCEYSIFKDIYRLYMRNLQRLNSTMFLAIINIRYSGLSETNALELDFAMRRLRDLLRDNLRTGDTISRYSPSQYAILLPSIETFDVGDMVMKRLRSTFYSDTENSGYKFDFKLMELGKDS